MRYSKDHRESTHKRIVDIASKKFREDGVHAVGIATLMKDVGLTHGGFYSHFKSKEELAVKAISQALEESMASLISYTEKHGGDLEALVSGYLHPKHRDAPGNGCAIAAIGSELSRRPQASQKVLSDILENFFAMVEHYLPRLWTPEKRNRIAVSIFTLMVGTLQVSRMMLDQNQKDKVLQDGINAALILARG